MQNNKNLVSSLFSGSQARHTVALKILPLGELLIVMD